MVIVINGFGEAFNVPPKFKLKRVIETQEEQCLAMVVLIDRDTDKEEDVWVVSFITCEYENELQRNQDAIKRADQLIIDLTEAIANEDYIIDLSKGEWN